MKHSTATSSTLGRCLRNLAAAGAVTCFALLGTLHIKQRSHQRSAGYIMKSVVTIGVGNFVSGGGVVLKGGRYILTVNHVTENMMAKTIIVTYRDGMRTKAKVVRRNKHFDIAVLRVEDININVPGLSIADPSSIKLGDKVRTFGHPHGLVWMLSEGIVSRKSYFPIGSEGKKFLIWTTAWIERGNSGGPLVNEDGEIVGLVMAMVAPYGSTYGAKHLNLCVSASEIRRFLDNP